MIRIVRANDKRLSEFNSRPAFPEEAEKAASEVLSAIRKEGDSAVKRYVRKFEGYKGAQYKIDADLKSLEKSIDS